MGAGYSLLFGVVKVVDTTSTFNAADCKAGSVGDPAYGPRLMFQRALQGLENGGGLVKIDEVDLAISNWPWLISMAYARSGQSRTPSGVDWRRSQYLTVR